jgi:CarD family transcriptional regulator
VAPVFKEGDAVVHPVHGAGVVEVVEHRELGGRSDQFYRIKLLSQPASNLILPTKAADALGLRKAIARSRLGRVWRVLRSAPESLPSDHKERYEAVQGKLQAGDVLRVAEAVRDLTWRQQQEGSLTTRGKRIFDEGMSLLAGEIAAAQGIEITDAELQVRSRLEKALGKAG